MTKEEALAKHLEEDIDMIIESKYDEDEFEVYEQEYLVLTDEEADERAKEYILESVWSFNAWFLVAHMPEGVDEDAIKLIQEKCCEDANNTFLAMIEDKDYFVEDAISTDGRGHFLSSYDGSEYEVEGYYIYRTN